ncbi:MAG TPA: response regulator [Bdellovibrionales bacterium]|nr:MAG: hypothetical protein A2Z97_03210 [Bdellovibrionales bacterium GWB1_52_6]OFZ02881.1 MAG: hypothetical protein A2X97_04735 [Bdellovibrionales bacterium GWA1_52_35]OFZ33760.1 MAG: hypothetical protein A2070_14365 [Bdellovibrionales bacterium GWC1_52_8]HAR43913.1 response regulator [Bdellovibrionales bacterium]HCM38464.1 response regulator [Bdellovibrionales bacterium]
MTITADIVLVIEDDPSLAASMEMLLRAAQVEVLSAGNGLEALQLLEHHKPDLILLDMKMPIMDGWEFAKLFYQKYGHTIPIIVLTAAENAGKRAEEIQADDFVSKPFQIDELLKKLSRFVRVEIF